jgi:glycine/sarcosine N-methyltransferase
VNQATDFYDALAPMFDVMTDWDARLAAEGPFLQAQLDAVGARRVLDAACGSGGHALWFARQGYEVAGADVSPVMIDLARQKASAVRLDVELFVTDLANLQPANLERATPYDAVLCLGNSLPHLLTQADLVAALRGMASVLRFGGLLILQNLNYDLRWQKQPRWFAAQGGELDGQPVLVWRFADYDVPAGRIDFHIALFRQGERDWKVDVHTTPQRPLFRVDLLAALAEAGFGDVQSYNKMALPHELFDPDSSGDLVIAARKQIAD